MSQEAPVTQTLTEKVKIYIADMTNQAREVAIDLTPEPPSIDVWLHLVRTTGREYDSIQAEIDELEDKLEQAQVRKLEAYESFHEACEKLIDFARKWERS